jgi:hypothetical protein
MSPSRRPWQEAIQASRSLDVVGVIPLPIATHPQGRGCDLQFHETLVFPRRRTETSELRKAGQLDATEPGRIVVRNEIEAQQKGACAQQSVGKYLQLVSSPFRLQIAAQERDPRSLLLIVTRID